ncbi:ribosome biogenesis protein tsr1 [Cryptotrichosporon argae]
MPDGHHHRATLKQSNKGFKSKHASKGSLKAAQKGKVEARAPGGFKHKSVEAGSKKARLHHNAQKRDAKRRAVGTDVRFFSTSSGGGHAPRIVTVVPLLPSVSPHAFLSSLLPTLDLPPAELDAARAALAAAPAGSSTHLLRAPRFKTALQVNVVPALDVYAALDAALVSDYVVLLLSSTDEVQLEGEAVLRCLQGQAGTVEVIPVVQAPADKPTTPATKQLIHKSLLSFTRYFYPAVEKVHAADTAADAALVARALCEGAPATRREDGRAYVVAEAVRATPHGDGADTATVEVTGTVRSGCLSADRLVHVPGWGDLMVEAIMPAPPSALALAARPRQHAMAVDADAAPLSARSDAADDLTSHNVPDLLNNEQTWPTEDELARGEAAARENDAKGSKRVKRVPKGTSAYQAAWIFDDDEEGDGAEDDDEDDDEDGMDVEGEGEGDVSGAEDRDDEEEEEMEDVELDERKEEHKDMGAEQEEEQYAAYLRARELAARDDAAFPDEIDTPRHVAARTRFQRYRGLKSFRTSPWDPYEQLPLEYGEIFQFENWKATGKRVEREARESGVKPGTRVTVVLRDVPAALVQARDPAAPFVLHGLLQHEHKQSVLHFVVQRNTEYTETVRAKDPLVLCLGPRRYVINPLFSQHVRGGGPGVNNVHKSERFLRPGTATVATTFGPVWFGKAACLLLKDEGAGKPPSLVAMGTALPPDPTRIIAKRIVLTGHPFKVHKKTATIRYMFFDRDDVDYYRSVELRTKLGKVGHIKEALGTHGYFKAHFDAPVQQMDTVCMSLYKRQFPKWSREFAPGATQAAAGGDMEIE